jgi:polyhydroxyalkanoate synthase subunit PhaC
VRDNTLVDGGTPVGDRTVDLADITSPLLCMVADSDHICPPAAATPVVDLVSSDTTRVVSIPAGHIGLIISRTASKLTLPALVDWLTTEPEGAS